MWLYIFANCSHMH